MDEKQKNEATNAVAKANKGFSSIMMVKVNEITQSSGCVLSVKDKTFAQDIILSTYKKMVEENIDPNDINFMGCNFPGQVKRFARLGLSLNENEIWLDIRNNSKTGKKDINLKVQYQGEEKLIIKFCKENGGVINIIKDVIMEGEELVTSRNFKTGDYIISDHKIPDILHRNINSANKNNVIGAYAIAYHEDGTQTAIVIDKDRIERAMNAAQTKIVWNNDYKKMVLKTVIHELYKELSKFNVIPDELQEDYQEMIMNKEEVQAEIDANANSEVFEADFSVKDEPHHINQTSSSPQFNPDTGEVIKEKASVENPKDEEHMQSKTPVGGPSF